MNNSIDKNYLALGVNSFGHSVASSHSEHALLHKSNPNKGVQNDLYAAADQFEAIFIETLLKQARQSKLSTELFDSKADDNFEQMFDQEIANSTSKLVDIGIADAIVRQMSKG